MLGGEAPPDDGDAEDAEAADEADERRRGARRTCSGSRSRSRPAGKEMKRLSLLSGGEKSMTALAFLFAVFLARPCPFYILDEVEAALDDLNIDRFLALLRQYSPRAQFIVVTHQKRTMEAADSLYGVSMGADGISKVDLAPAADAERPRRSPRHLRTLLTSPPPWRATGAICSSSTAPRRRDAADARAGGARGARGGRFRRLRESLRKTRQALPARSRRRCSRTSTRRPGSASRRR